MLRCSVVVPIALSLVVAWAGLAPAEHYVITDLGTLSGQPNSQAFGVNSSGAVTGFSYTTIGTGPSDDPRAFLWTSAGGMQNIGALFSYTNKTYAMGINDGGQVVGYSVPPVPQPHGFVYSGGTMTDLYNAPGVLYHNFISNWAPTGTFRGVAINENGDIAGRYSGGGGSFLYYAGGTSIDLGSLNPGDNNGGAQALDNSDVVVGSGMNPGPMDPSQHPWIWTSAGGLVPLFTSNPTGVAFGIDDLGNVVGEIGSSSAAGGLAFITASPSGGTVSSYTNIGTLAGGTWSGAYGVSNGVAVGALGSANGTHAFRYTAADGLQDLNDLIAPNLGWTLQGASAISTSGGYIAGYGTIGGNTHAFRLAPAILGDANLDGKVDINDLTKVLTNYNQTTTPATGWGLGDFNGDGKVDINDLTIVLAHYNQSLSSSAAGMAAVPEPGPLSLLAAGLIGFLACAWRRRK